MISHKTMLYGDGLSGLVVVSLKFNPHLHFRFFFTYVGSLPRKYHPFYACPISSVWLFEALFAHGLYLSYLVRLLLAL